MTCSFFACSSEPGGNWAASSSSRNGCVLSQMPLLGHQLRGRVVHQMAVLDALDAGRDRALDRRRRVGVHGDVGAPVLGRFDRGAQLGLGEGRDVERAERRGDAAAGRQLDLRWRPASAARARAARTSSGLSAIMLPPICSMRLSRPPMRARQLGELAEVAVAAGDGDHRAGRIDARARNEALVDGPLEPESRARPCRARW